jgi:hypothetical protein
VGAAAILVTALAATTPLTTAAKKDRGFSEGEGAAKASAAGGVLFL